jgi:hypothetical protein
MSCEQIQNHLYKNHGIDIRQLSEKLPSHNNFRWVPWRSKGSSTGLCEALVIGTEPSREIIAYNIGKNDQPKIRYSWADKETTDRSLSPKQLQHPPTSEEAIHLPPFRYNFGSSKPEKKKFATVIKWYFTARGLLPVAVTGDLSSWCDTFILALNNIPSEHVTVNDKTTSPKGKLPGQEKEAPHVEGSTSSRPSLRASGERGSPKPAATAEDSSDTVVVSNHALHPEYEELCHYLEQRGEIDQLKNIPKPDASTIQFEDNRWSIGHPLQKLYIGKIVGSNRNIYSHLTVSKGTYTIDYECFGRKLRPNEFATANLVHPFRHTCPKHKALEPADLDRLEAIVLWYFIARKYIPDKKLPGNAHRFLERISDTLKYISGSMEARKLEILRGETCTPVSPPGNKGNSEDLTASNPVSVVIPAQLAKSSTVSRPSDTVSTPTPSTSAFAPESSNISIGPPSLDNITVSTPSDVRIRFQVTSAGLRTNNVGTSPSSTTRPTSSTTTAEPTALASAPRPSIFTSASDSDGQAAVVETDGQVPVAEMDGQVAEAEAEVGTDCFAAELNIFSSGTQAEPDHLGAETASMSRTSDSVPSPIMTAPASSPRPSVSASVPTAFSTHLPTPGPTPSINDTSSVVSETSLPRSASVPASQTLDLSAASAIATPQRPIPHTASLGTKRAADDDVDDPEWLERRNCLLARLEAHDEVGCMKRSLKRIEVSASTHEHANTSHYKAWTSEMQTEDAAVEEAEAEEEKNSEEVKRKRKELEALEAVGDAWREEKYRRRAKREDLRRERSDWVNARKPVYDKLLEEKSKLLRELEEAKEKVTMLERYERDFFGD